MNQLSLIKDVWRLEFGGSLSVKRRKSFRPLDTRKPHHLVLKATNGNTLLRSKRLIQSELDHYAKRFGLTIYSLAVHADHLHLQIRIPHRELYRRWIRAITSRLVSKIKGLKWRFLPYTRVGSWGRELKALKNYLRVNNGEACVIEQAHEVHNKWRTSIMLPLISAHPELGEALFENLNLPSRRFGLTFYGEEL